MSEENETVTPEVVNTPGDHRYVIRVGGTEVGHTVYTDRGNQRVFLHTEIDPAFEGHGYGSTLMFDTLTQVREAGLRAVPVCPFMVGYLKRHRDFDDIVDPVSIELRKTL
ncbi:GNAT family N-acetyltransferase [Herbiconiux daphne]